MLDRMRRGAQATIFAYDYALGLVHRAISAVPPSYHNVLSEVCGFARVTIPSTCHLLVHRVHRAVRAVPPSYRYALGEVRGFVSTIPSSYCLGLDRMRRGIRATSLT